MPFRSKLLMLELPPAATLRSGGKDKRPLYDPRNIACVSFKGEADIAPIAVGFLRRLSGQRVTFVHLGASLKPHDYGPKFHAAGAGRRISSTRVAPHGLSCLGICSA